MLGYFGLMGFQGCDQFAYAQFPLVCEQGDDAQAGGVCECGDEGLRVCRHGSRSEHIHSREYNGITDMSSQERAGRAVQRWKGLSLGAQDK